MRLWSLQHPLRAGICWPRVKPARDPGKQSPVGDLNCSFHSNLGIFLRRFHSWNFKEGLSSNKLAVNLRKHCAFFIVVVVLINLAFFFCTEPLTNYWTFSPLMAVLDKNNNSSNYKALLAYYKLWWCKYVAEYLVGFIFFPWKYA